MQGDNIVPYDVENYRQTPHNLEAEQALLGAILVNNEAVARVQDFLKEEHFVNPAHQKIFQACLQLIEKGLIASPVTLKPYFENEETLAEIGGAGYLARLATAAVSIINTVEYGQIIYQMAIKRELITVGTDIVNDAYDHDVENSVQAQIEEAEKRLYSLAEQGSSESGFKSFAKSATDAVNIIEMAFKRGGKLAGKTTGFDSINKHIGGLHKSDLMILAGRPAMGKTALATNMAFNAAKAYRDDALLGVPHEENKGAVVAFFSLEMSADQLAARILSEQASLSSQDLRQGRLDQEQFNKLARTAQDLEELPLFIDDTASLTIGALRTRARRLKRQHGLGFLVIDYLQLLSGSSRNGRGPENRVQEISEITRGLKGLAKELEIPVLALSQLSRTIESRDNKRPLLSDLRESGSIEQDADMVTFVYRPEYYHNQVEPDADTPEHMIWQEEGEKLFGKAEFIIGKQRHGPTGIITLQFEANTTRFSDLPTSDDYLPAQNE
ncbi:replicative DNA helicase [Paremcibacter congregatus]|uniref:Replicative DNA helicase n=1 Tax=Paremcibacter congregatus TaxID=2043170 RepID=A0A2G4YVJ8_9PROT|nr:replicative DNA helicase [Paremcibacter congregatus]QDE29200.1 replicative DNA helicase [Paremcibacter congregatus]